MKMEFEMKDNVLIVKFSGEIDHHETKKARNEIDSAYNAFGKKHIILDFSEVSFVDSSGIGMIMGRYKKVTSNGGKVVIAGASEYMKNILCMSGIFTIIEEKRTLSDALDCILENGDDGGKIYDRKHDA